MSSQEPYPWFSDPQRKGFQNQRGLWERRVPGHTLGSTAQGICTGQISTHNVWLQKSVGLRSGGVYGVQTQLTCSKSQHRGSSFKSAWVNREGDPSTNFRVCIREWGICWNVVWGCKCWQEPFLTLSIYWASTVHLMLTFACGLTLPNCLPPPSIPPKWLPAPQNMVVASAGISDPNPGSHPCTPEHLQQSQPYLTASCIRNLSHLSHPSALLHLS